MERDRTGGCPMYRGNIWQRRERDKESIEKKNNWYEKGGHETVTFVKATPNEGLAKACRKAHKESELKIRVVERAGKSFEENIGKIRSF